MGGAVEVAAASLGSVASGASANTARTRGSLRRAGQQHAGPVDAVQRLDSAVRAASSARPRSWAPSVAAVDEDRVQPVAAELGQQLR